MTEPLEASRYRVAGPGVVPDGPQLEPLDWSPEPCSFCGGRRYGQNSYGRWWWESHIHLQVGYGYRFADTLFESISFCTVECMSAYALAGEWEPVVVDGELQLREADAGEMRQRLDDVFSTWERKQPPQKDGD